MASLGKELKSVSFLPVVNLSCIQVLARWFSTPEPDVARQSQSWCQHNYSTGIMPGPIYPFILEDLLLRSIEQICVSQIERQ